VHNYGDPPEQFDPSCLTFQGPSRSLELAWFDQLPSYDFLLLSHTNYGPVLYCFQDKGQYLQNLPTPMYLMAPVREFLWNFVVAVWLERTRM